MNPVDLARRFLTGLVSAPVEYVFILSAMRSGSTLLQHIIGQESRALSAGETKLEYQILADLASLRDHLFSYNEIEEADRKADWLFIEKSVHERYVPSIENLQDPSIRFVFILRDPHAALTSLLERKGWPYTESIEAAAWYYTERPKQLVELARQLKDPKHAYFLTYEDLLAHTDLHLAGLSRFIKAAKPFEASYPKQKWTAVMSLGDVSGNIKREQIVKNQRDELVDMPSELYQQMTQTYEQCTASLNELCDAQNHK